MSFWLPKYLTVSFIGLLSISSSGAERCLDGKALLAESASASLVAYPADSLRSQMRDTELLLATGVPVLIVLRESSSAGDLPAILANLEPKHLHLTVSAPRALGPPRLGDTLYVLRPDPQQKPERVKQDAVYASRRHRLFNFAPHKSERGFRDQLKIARFKLKRNEAVSLKTWAHRHHRANNPYLPEVEMNAFLAVLGREFGPLELADLNIVNAAEGHEISATLRLAPTGERN